MTNQPKYITICNHIAYLIIVLLPFLILKQITDVWFDESESFIVNGIYAFKGLVFQWMRHNDYLKLWFIFAMLSFIWPRFSCIGAWGVGVSTVISQFLADAIHINELKKPYTQEELMMSDQGRLSYPGMVICVQLFISILVLYVVYIKVIEPKLKYKHPYTLRLANA